MSNTPNILSVMKYASNKRYVSVPILQKEFGISYKSAQEITRELVKRGLMRFVSGITFEYVGEKITDDVANFESEQEEKDSTTSQTDQSQQNSDNSLDSLLDDDNDDDDDILDSLLDDDNDDDDADDGKEDQAIDYEKQRRSQIMRDRLDIDFNLRKISHLTEKLDGLFCFDTGFSNPVGEKILFEIKRDNDRFVISDGGAVFDYLLSVKTEKDKYSVSQYLAKEIVYSHGASMKNGAYSFEGEIVLYFDIAQKAREAITTMLFIVFQIYKLGDNSLMFKFYDDSAFFAAYVAKLVFPAKKEFSRADAESALKKFSVNQHGSHYAACQSLINALNRMSELEYQRYKKAFEENEW